MKKEITNKLQAYIAENYFPKDNRILFSVERYSRQAHAKISKETFLVDEPFNVKLFKLIDASGKSDVEIYKKAGIDRRHFSKIKSSSDYIPQKKTILAFIIALELSLEEAELLLESAGFSLSNSYLFDVIVKFFISERSYDIALINECLLEYDQPLIGY